jgi:thiamine biosynthesis protein ThiS
MPADIQIIVNGERREVPEGLGVSGLLSHLGLPADRVAIERNLEILPRSQWIATAVQPGDRYEIVQLVGGG